MTGKRVMEETLRGAFCQRCDAYYEWPWGRRKKLVDFPCPKCGGPGRACTREQYEADRARLKRWQEVMG